jgi:S-adenosylmethionine hydrolase
MAIITLLSDFGLKDTYVAEMKAVILSINPNAVIVDLTHEIPKYDIRLGAFALASAAPYFPRNTVHLAVVDPSVGSKRKPIVVETKKNMYVGPDNGLLMLAAETEEVNEVFEITQKRFMRKDVSNTFHGRDLFSPVAAYLSKGVQAKEIGKPLKMYSKPSFSSASTEDGFVDCEVLHIDSFGNVITNVRREDLFAIGARLGSRLRLGNRRFTFLQTYSDVARRSFLGLIGSHGFFEIASNQHNAARLLHLKTGKKLRLSVTN